MYHILRPVGCVFCAGSDAALADQCVVRLTTCMQARCSWCCLRRSSGSSGRRVFLLKVWFRGLFRCWPVA
jgi:hypothetical protein